MIVFGIDPGSLTTGYGIVQEENNVIRCIDHGVIQPKSSLPVMKRIAEIFLRLSALLDQIRPNAVVFEKIFFSKNARSTIALGEVRGALIAAAAIRNIEIYEYTPREVKQAVIGYGNATKEQIQQMMKLLLSLQTPPLSDAADALAIAICHTHQMRYLERTQKALSM